MSAACVELVAFCRIALVCSKLCIEAPARVVIGVVCTYTHWIHCIGEVARQRIGCYGNVFRFPFPLDPIKPAFYHVSRVRRVGVWTN